MRRSPLCLRAFLAVALFSALWCVPHAFADGASAPRWKGIAFSSEEAGPPPETPLGGPIAPLGKSPSPVVNSNAATKAPSSTGGGSAANSSDDQPQPGTPTYPGVTYSGATENATTNGQPPAALGPAPYDLGDIKKLQVGSLSVAEAPLRVGNLDVLAPLVDEMPALGVSVTRADPKNVPGSLNTPTEGQYFQINLPTGAPIVLTIGKSSAWIGSAEQPLRAAPLVIGKQIYLPVFSLAPLIGAATRLNDQGTLVLTPTIQSVELFPLKDTVAITIKTSAPVPPGLAKIVAFPGAANSSPKLYIDFPGYSMGFDASNSTFERQIAPGTGDVLRARAGMPSKFPDTTRIVLDLKRPFVGMQQDVPDPTLFALVLAQQGQTPPRVTQNTLEPSFSPPIVMSDPTVGLNMRSPASLRGLTIVVDAGHGGYDTGALGGSSKEKDHTLDIARRLRNHLQARGANVLMTRDGDYFISLEGRTSFANSRHADLFVSVHINASVNPGSTGTETFYYTAISQSLAREVHKELAKATGCPSRGIAQARFYVVRKTVMPSILTESAFITNSHEEALLRDQNFRERIARGIAQGISNYIAIYGRPALNG